MQVRRVHTKKLPRKSDPGQKTFRVYEINTNKLPYYLICQLTPLHPLFINTRRDKRALVSKTSPPLPAPTWSCAALCLVSFILRPLPPHEHAALHQIQPLRRDWHSKDDIDLQHTIGLHTRRQIHEEPCVDTAYCPPSVATEHEHRLTSPRLRL